MKNYKEDSYVEWLTEFYEKRPIYYTDRINDVLYIYCQYDTKKRGRYSRIRVVKIYTEPIKIENSTDMRQLSR